MKIAKPQAVAVALCLSLSAALSAQNRQHGTHEHGVAGLLVAIEGPQVQLLLESPLFNLVGFGKAQSEQQHHQIEEIEQFLNNPLALFTVKGVTCVAVSTTLSGDAFEAEHTESHEDGHAEDEHEDKHEGEHEGEHAEHEESSHADVQVEWLLDCPEISQASALRMSLFEHFEHLEQLDVQYLFGDKQGAEKMTAEHAELQF